MMNEFVHTIMTKNPISLNVKDNLWSVKKIFDENRIHHLPVTNDKGDLVGLITTYDLWQLNKEFNEYKSIHVEEVMNKKVLKIASDDKIGTAAELFLDRRFHALPVVEGEKLVGIVTSFDILRYEFRKEYDKPILFEEIYADGLRAVV